MPQMHLVDARAGADAGSAAVEVVLAGWSVAAADTLSGELRLRGIAARSESVAALTALAARGDAAVLALGPELSGGAAAEVVREAHRSWLVLVLAAGETTDLYQEWNDLDRLFFLTKQPPSPADTVELLVAAHARVTQRAPDDDADAELQGRVLDLLRRLERETGVPSALQHIAREAPIVGDADRAELWLYDDRAEHLTADTRKESAAGGLTSYVARTGRGLAVEHAGDDVRYDPKLDGDARARFLAWPIAIPEEQRTRVLAVLTLTRPQHAQPFGDDDRRRVDWMTRLLAPALARLVFEADLETRAAARHTAIREDMTQLFRGEALEQYQRGRSDDGHLLEIEPSWTRRAYAVILALLATALLLSTLVHVDRNAEGAGVVRGARLIAALPARHRDALRPGMTMRFDLAAQPLAISSVSPRIIGSSETRRLLGPDGAALWTSASPGVLVDAPIPGGGQLYGDGVAGRVTVRIRRERLLFALLPALRSRR